MAQTNLKSQLLAIAAIVLIFQSCEKADIATDTNESEVLATVNLDFTTSETDWTATRAASAADLITNIALSVFDSDEKKVMDLTQVKGDTDFGTFSPIRLAPGTYKFVVVAHKAQTPASELATITSPTSATLPGSFLYETYTTVKEVKLEANNYKPQTVDITVPLCVTKLTFETLDEVPSDVTFIRLTVNSGAEAATSLSFNPTEGVFASDASFSRTWDITSSVGKTVTLSITAMMTEYPKDVDVCVEALDANNKVVDTRTFEGITFNRAKIRIIKANLFADGVGGKFTFEEWSEEEPMVIE